MRSRQVNKLANYFWTADPIARMQYEHDSAVEQLKEGRQVLEQYRALVERVGRQVANNKAHGEQTMEKALAEQALHDFEVDGSGHSGNRQSNGRAQKLGPANVTKETARQS